ncbi:MAG: hypothetical protein IPP53_11570 [Bacteroidetes bacterium]|nr:hypothetical protein [Bacteroidota bacterium]
MLKYFEISFRDKETLNNKENNLKGMLVGVNLNYRLKQLRYIKNTRINLEFLDINTEKVEKVKSDRTTQISNNNSINGHNDKVCNIYAPLTKNEQTKLFSSENYLTNLLMLSIIQLKEYWRIQKWNEVDLDAIQKEIIEEDFKFSIELLKATNNIRSNKVVIFANFFKEYCNLELKLFKKRDLVDNQLLFKAQILSPFMFNIYASVLGGILWVEENEFDINSLFVGLVYKIKIVNNKFEFVIKPETTERKAVQYLVDSFRYETNEVDSMEFYKNAMMS